MRFSAVPEAIASESLVVAVTNVPALVTPARAIDDAQPGVLTQLSVIVRDSAGASIPGATVCFNERANLRVGSLALTTEARKSAIGITDGAGAAIGHTSRTSVTDVCVSQIGFSVASATVEPGRTRLELVMRRPASMKLTFVDDATHEPIRACSFELELNGSTRQIKTNDEGSSVVRDLTPGKILAEVRSPICIPAPISIKSLDEGVEASCEVRVRKGKNLRSLVQLNGLPADGAVVSIYDRWTSKLVARIQTGADGLLTLPVGIDDHDYVAVAELGDYAGDVALSSNGELSYLALLATWRFGISALADGREIPGARAILVRADGLPSGPTGRGIEFTCDQRGYVDIDGLIDGVAYRLIVMADGRAIGEWRAIDRASAGSMSITCSLPPASSIAGIALASDGTPVIGAVVRVTRADSASGPAMFTVTDADGRYSFTGIAQGTVNILPFFPGFDGRRRAFATGDQNANVQLDRL